MKRNLQRGIILISITVLSSCATLTDISKKPVLGDDVYYTKAKAGVSNYYVPEYVIEPQPEIARNDDYYYYGDYESRIRHFGYSSPLSYNDDYYDDGYVPYSSSSSIQNNPDQNYDAPYDYTYDPYYDDLGVYSAYDFGYGDYYGYDNFGYGIAYSTFIHGGGTRATHRKDYAYSNSYNGPVFERANRGRNRYSSSFGINVARNSGTGSNANNNTGGPAFVRGSGGSDNTPIFRGARPGGNNAVYPGRPGSNLVNQQGNIDVGGTNRAIRPITQNPRPNPVILQQPTIERSSPPQTSSSSSNSNSGGGGGGGGSSSGGGRPVRP